MASAANALLHASPVRGAGPAAVTAGPSRSRGRPSRWASAPARRRRSTSPSRRRTPRVPLRLVSLVELDAEGPRRKHQRAHIHANTVLTEAAHRLPAGHHVTVEVAHGRTIEEAIDDLGWDEGELLIVGSSRLAEKNKLFIGRTADKVLLALPVPMVVVPRDYERTSTHPGVPDYWSCTGRRAIPGRPGGLRRRRGPVSGLRSSSAREQHVHGEHQQRQPDDAEADPAVRRHGLVNTASATMNCSTGAKYCSRPIVVIGSRRAEAPKNSSGTAVMMPDAARSQKCAGP